MSSLFSEAELEAYLDEALTPEEMAKVELALRDRQDLLERLAEINNRRDAGVHSLGAMWRRHRISCPAREQLGSFLLGAVEPAVEKYIAFHLEKIGCRYCQANLDDLRNQHQEADEKKSRRRKKYFQTSAGFLRNKGSQKKSK